MKKGILFIILSSIALITIAQDDPYTSAMTEGIFLVEQAKGPDDFLAAANKFERIAAVEQDKWHAPYYAAYAMTIVAAMQSDLNTLDETLDGAQAFLDRSAAVDHDVSEVQALQGFIHMMRIGVDPATRGQQYSGLSGTALQKARQANPDNPRALFLSAQLSFGTAQFFGSDTSESCAMNKRALEKFEAAEQDNDKDPLAPAWGKDQAEAFKLNCLK